MGGRRNAALVRKPGQEAFDVGSAQRSRTTRAVKANVSANPVDIRLLGSYAVVQTANALAQLVQDRDRTQRRQMVGDGSIGLLAMSFYTA